MSPHYCSHEHTYEGNTFLCSQQGPHTHDACTCPGPTMTDTSCPMHGDDDD